MKKKECHSENGQETNESCVSNLMVGLMLAASLLTMDGVSLALDPAPLLSPDSPEAEITVQRALHLQIQRVDQQIADFEARFVTVKHDRSPSPFPTDANAMEESAQQVVQAEGPTTTQEEEVQVLEETLVTDSYVDPFDEGRNEEVVEDPWEPMNTRMFSFNMQADRYVLKPLAMGYAWILPDPMERAIGRAINNIRFVPRTMNNLFQQKWSGASMETGRFLINSTIGIAGLFDVAESQFGLNPAGPNDFGQTLAMYGVRSGPYLILPLLPPTTVRDGAGMVGDALMDPLSYFIPFVPQTSLRATGIVNNRSQNLELYEGVESGTIDLYGAVRSGYMQRRSQEIQE